MHVGMCASVQTVWIGLHHPNSQASTASFITNERTNYSESAWLVLITVASSKQWCQTEREG